MKCEKCNKKVSMQDIEYDKEGYARHKGCGGKIIKSFVLESGGTVVYL